jgi:hypothetical protein
MRGPADIHESVHQRESRTLILFVGIESKHSADAAGSIARVGRCDDYRTVAALGAGRSVQRMKPFHVIGAEFLRPRDQKNRPRHRIDDRRSHDPEVATDISEISTRACQNVIR